VLAPVLLVEATVTECSFLATKSSDSSGETCDCVTGCIVESLAVVDVETEVVWQLGMPSVGSTIVVCRVLSACYISKIFGATPEPRSVA
jgi:hypothetical protein